MIEVCTIDRKLHIRGPFAADIAAMSDRLRRCRNAVMHVPRDNESLDQWIEDLVAVKDSPTAIRRIHAAFGRLFREEMQQQTAESNAAAGLASPPAGA